MRFRIRRALGVLLIAGALSGSLIALAAPSGGERTARATEAAARAPALVARGARSAAALAGFDPLRHRLEGQTFVSDLADGGKAELTLDPELQAHVERVLASYEVPYGALVAIDPRNGRVLAYVSHSSANPDAGDLARDPTPPAASVFKIVTSAALIDAGVSPDERLCYGGGMQRLALADLTDDPRRDRACITLSEAMATSTNAIFAKLADRKLDGATIERYAQAFGFGHALPFDVPTRVSPGEVPAERLERARTAAGFWHMHMSPLHGALIASTIANGGIMPRPSMVQREIDAGGRVRASFAPQAFRQVISKATARAVGQMMLGTVAHGTARSAFQDPKGRPFLPGIAVAGKTGSLSSERPYRAYSWFVGYAPEQKPEIALAALVVNTPKWRIKASYLAREALHRYLVAPKPKQTPAPSVPLPVPLPVPAGPTPAPTPAPTPPSSAAPSPAPSSTQR